MKRYLERAAALAGLATLGLCLLTAEARLDKPVLGQLAQTWREVADFSLDIEAHERDGEHTQDRMMRFAYLRPNYAKLQLLDGPMHGVVVVWTGGERLSAYHSGLLAGFKKGLPLDDPHASSLRGNSIMTPILGATISCFEAHRNAVSESAGPQVRGEATDEVTLRLDEGLQCPQDSQRDRAVTRDVLDVSRVSHLPVRRVRYVGAQEVERWELSNIRVNTGLHAQDFR